MNREFHESEFNPWEIPCLECGSLPTEGAEETAFMCVCSNEKCPMAIRAVQPFAWPTTKDQFNKAIKQP